MDRRDYKGSEELFIGAVWNRSFAKGVHHTVHQRSSSQKLHRSSLRQFKTNEEPEEVTGLCDVIGSVISDCKHRLMYIQ
jgi:hypothetical protein